MQIKIIVFKQNMRKLLFAHGSDILWKSIEKYAKACYNYIIISLQIKKHIECIM